jgi:hypothetical protein
MLLFYHPGEREVSSPNYPPLLMDPNLWNMDPARKVDSIICISLKFNVPTYPQQIFNQFHVGVQDKNSLLFTLPR